MPRRKLYIPVWQLLLAVPVGLLLLAGAIFVGRQIVAKHRSSLIEVPQSQVNTASEVSKTYGAPQASEAAQKSGKKLTILFFYDGYKNESTALRQVGLMQGALKNTQPFATSDVIDTKVITSSTQRCHVERHAQNLLVCDTELITEINKLNIKNFKLVVLSPLDFVPNARVARGKNVALYLPAYKGSLTDEELSMFLARFFLHELGHTFGLRDEYAFERSGRANYESTSTSLAYQAARPNCAPDEATAKKWWGSYQAGSQKIGYNYGCAGNKAFVFPQKDTLMSDNPQDADYGKVSEDYLRGVLDCFFGGKTKIAYLATSEPAITGRVEACSDFKAQFPHFWDE